jgi:hypothetical protein
LLALRQAFFYFFPQAKITNWPKFEPFLPNFAKATANTPKTHTPKAAHISANH